MSTCQYVATSSDQYALDYAVWQKKPYSYCEKKCCVV